MDLWVRSQDKEKLEKVTNIQYYYKINPYGIGGAGGNHYIGTYFDNLCIFGEYKTKKRALEVLDEIDEFIDLFNRNGFGNVLSDDGIHQKHTVYQMPKE